MRLNPKRLMPASPHEQIARYEEAVAHFVKTGKDHQKIARRVTPAVAAWLDEKERKERERVRAQREAERKRKRRKRREDARVTFMLLICIAAWAFVAWAFVTMGTGH